MYNRKLCIWGVLRISYVVEDALSSSFPVRYEDPMSLHLADCSSGPQAHVPGSSSSCSSLPSYSSRALRSFVFVC